MIHQPEPEEKRMEVELLHESDQGLAPATSADEGIVKMDNED